MLRSKLMHFWIFVGVAASLLMLVAFPYGSKSNALENPSVEELEAAIVSILPSGRCDRNSATGFLISQEGYILTAQHVVANFDVGTEVRVGWLNLATGMVQTFLAKVLDKKPDQDVALLKIENAQGHDFPWLLLGNSDEVRKGDSITVIGFPTPGKLRCEIPIETSGEVTARKPARALPEDLEYYKEEAFQISVSPIRPGSSGSPLIDNASRKVIGILFAGTTPEPFYFAVPINVAIDHVIEPGILSRYPPEITFLEFPLGTQHPPTLTPPTIWADGKSVKGKIGFRDLNADLYTVRFELLEAKDLEIRPDIEIYVKAFPEVEDKRTGEVEFTIATETPQRVRLQVTLNDGLGPGESQEFSFEAKAPAPEITSLVCPPRIAADGSEHIGIVKFRDPNGDVALATFEVKGELSAPPRTLNLLDNPKVHGQVEGSFEFTIATRVPQPKVTLKITLSDERNHYSKPEECSFEASSGPLSDLTVSLDSEGLPAQAQVGDFLDVKYSVHNQGETDSGPFRVGVYLSADFMITTGDLLLGSDEIPNLTSGASLTKELRAGIPQDLFSRPDFQPGDIFLGVIADDTDRVQESNEGNNTASDKIRVVLPVERPVADFTAEPTSGPAPLAVRFTNLSTNSTSSLWDFGDGKTSTETNPRHTYQNPGSYTVKLTVRGPGGEITIVKQNYINVTSPSLARTLRVPQDFSTIQAALDAARDGNTILVGPGTYEGNWTITKSITLEGEDKERVILKGVQAGTSVIAISSPVQVTVEGFSITEDSRSGSGQLVSGIMVGGFAEVTIRNNRIFRIIGGPLVGCNLGCGIHVGGFAQATISGNEITEMGMEAIWLDGNAEATIEGNTLTLCMSDSINVEGLAKAIIRGNWISNNGAGISLGGIDLRQASSQVTVEISNNEITKNLGFGVVLIILECYTDNPWATETFDGTVTGKGNTIEGNGRDVCPDALKFLKTPVGGRYP